MRVTPALPMSLKTAAVGDEHFMLCRRPNQTESRYAQGRCGKSEHAFLE